MEKDIPNIIKTDINIKIRIDGYGLDWTSSNMEILPLTGGVNRIDEDVQVTLTAKLSYFDFKDKFEKEVIVKKRS